MKSWKMWKSLTRGGGPWIYPTPGEAGSEASPVLVIDASDFPEGYPEIDSKWVYTTTVGTKHTAIVRGYPIKDTIGTWRVVVQYSGSTLTMPIASLSPIPEEPKTATGEVVGTITVSPEKWEISEAPFVGDWPKGKYDIIKRGDK